MTYALAEACVGRNLDLRFVWVVALGGLLNFIAIAANGEVMPASRGIETAGLEVQSGSFPTPTSSRGSSGSSATSSPSPPAGRARTCSALGMR